MERKRGLFVVFEGIDGAGTSTQLIKLIEYVEDLDKYQDILRTHEPWKSAGIKRRLSLDREAYSDAKSMAELFISDRERHSFELIEPNLERGVFVFCDRYKMSTCAYQWTQGVSLYKLLKMHEDRGIIKPDLNIYLDVSAEIAQNRRLKRGGEVEKFEEFKFQRDLVSHYNSLVSRPDAFELFGQIAIVNGRESIDEVASRVRRVFNSIYEKWKNNNQKP